MKSLKNIFESFKQLCIKYPAVLSGLIIYIYLLFSIIHYFIKAKTFSIDVYDIIDSFDAFPFMWLLAVALVKIIDIRTKLHQSEVQRTETERERNHHQSQLKTMHEVTRGLQHHINNPLAIIKLSLDPSRKAAEKNPKLLHQLDVIDEAVGRITMAMDEFAKASAYTVESAGPVVGAVIMPGPKKETNPEGPLKTD